jgi:hypothetical protein
MGERLWPARQRKRVKGRGRHSGAKYKCHGWLGGHLQDSIRRKLQSSRSF